MNEKLEIEKLRSILRLPADAPSVVHVTADGQPLQRLPPVGYVELKNDGISVMLKERPWTSVPERVQDPGVLFVAALHLYAKGYDGYRQYQGALPNGVRFGDREHEVVKKLGVPSETGGGTMSTVLKRITPKWMRYLQGDDVLQLQLDGEGRVEMVTLFAREMHPNVFRA